MSTRSSVTTRIRAIPLVGTAIAGTARVARRYAFPGSGSFWDRHYARGGSSGEGSQGMLADFKAEVLNDFVTRHAVRSVIEFGCGDGEQLARARYPRYLGLDVSPSTLRRVARRFADDRTKSFLRYDPECFTDPAGMLVAELALSLDVIYHLVEDSVYEAHLRHVFGAARRYVVLFTSDADTLPVTEPTGPHIRHRPVTRDVAGSFPDWRLVERIANRYPYQGAGTLTSFADFFVYERNLVEPCAASAE